MARTIEQHALARPLQPFIDRDPSIVAVNHRLAAYLPAAITQPYTRESLYASILREACFSGLSEGEGAFDAYLTTVLSRAAVLLRYNLVGEGGRWDPLFDPPLMVWLRTNPPPEAPDATDRHWTPLPVRAFVNGLFDRLVAPGTLARPQAIHELA